MTVLSEKIVPLVPLVLFIGYDCRREYRNTFIEIYNGLMLLAELVEPCRKFIEKIGCNVLDIYVKEILFPFCIPWDIRIDFCMFFIFTSYNYAIECSEAAEPPRKLGFRRSELFNSFYPAQSDLNRIPHQYTNKPVFKNGYPRRQGLKSGYPGINRY